jgi:hypothetical protein
MKEQCMTSIVLEQRLRLQEDRQALESLINDYLTLADSTRWVEWSETFTEDAQFDLPNAFGLMRGRQEIYDTCVGKMDTAWAITQHMIVNCDFDVEGDSATGSANIIFTGVPPGGARDKSYMMGGIYRWKFVRTAAGWKIADAWEEFLWNNGTEESEIFVKDA